MSLLLYDLLLHDDTNRIAASQKFISMKKKKNVAKQLRLAKNMNCTCTYVT